MITEISTMQADLIKSFAIFYLLLVGNYIGQSLFTCLQIHYINQHKLLQFIIAFFLFYFLVTVIADTGHLELTPPIEKLVYSFFYFIGFLLVMRLEIKITAVVLILIFAVYFIELNKDFYLEPPIKNKEEERIFMDNQYWITFDWPIEIRLFPVRKEDFMMINQLETGIYYLIIVLLVVGFIAYGGEIKDTLKHSKNLTWIDVIMDSQICELKNRKSFWHYLQMGLGIKI